MFKKTRILILAAVTMVVMLLGSTGVFAAVNDSTTEPSITKTVNVAEGVTIDSEVTFTIEQVANPAHDGNTFTAPVTGLSGTVSTSGLQNGTSTTGTKVVTIDNILTEAGIASSLTKVGEYTFKITENTSSLGNNWTGKDTNDFYLQVIVKNGENNSLVKTYSVTADEPSGTSSASNKTELTFENTFTKSGSLQVKKTVSAGAGYVDADKEFEFTVVFTGSNTATVEKYTASGATVTYGDISGTGASSTVTGTFKLKKNGTVSFANVPVGVTYTVTETTPTDTTYDKSVTKVNDTTCSSQTATGEQKITETSGGDKVVVDNQYKTISPTGIVTHYLPYIAIILLAIGAFAFFVASRRRRAVRY